MRSKETCRSIANHGIDFAAAEHVDWATAVVKSDTRFYDAEVRLRAVGMMNGKLHSLVFTIRKNTTWLISLRRASRREHQEDEAEA